MTVTEKTVNGKTLSTFGETHQGESETVARKILANDSDVTDVTAFSSGRTEVWLRGVDRMNWRAPDGWHITAVSMFGDFEENRRGAACITIRPDE